MQLSSNNYNDEIKSQKDSTHRIDEISEKSKSNIAGPNINEYKAIV